MSNTTTSTAKDLVLKWVREIPLTQGKVAIVDACDFERLNQWKWYVKRRNEAVWYATRAISTNDERRTIKMHREILQAKTGEIIDHINGDGLDNRRCNLRLCSASENGANRRKYKAKSSKYKGVSFKKNKGAFVAQITVRGKVKWLGTFKDERDAAIAYDKAAIQNYGAFALTNLKHAS